MFETPITLPCVWMAMAWVVIAILKLTGSSYQEMLNAFALALLVSYMSMATLDHIGLDAWGSFRFDNPDAIVFMLLTVAGIGIVYKVESPAPQPEID